MSTGRRLWKGRPRNDLDEYLDDVVSRLFCVSRADRRCLLRDIKAHVKELTTDSDKADYFKGRYGITREQLENEVGVPEEISDMYISSVKKRPSLGMIAYLSFSVVFFTIALLVAFDLISIGNQLGGMQGESYISSGWILAAGAATAVGACALCWRSFERFHYLSVYLAIGLVAFALPVSLTLSGEVSKVRFGQIFPDIDRMFTWVFVMDIVLVAIAGLYTALSHYRVYNPRRSQLV